MEAMIIMHFGLAMAVMMFYKLDNKQLAQIQIELAARKGVAQPKVN